jgi:Holliday junction resolvasome RuvABC endonuclease subunit
MQEEQEKSTGRQMILDVGVGVDVDDIHVDPSTNEDETEPIEKSDDRAVLVVDPALTSGWCLIRFTGQEENLQADIYEYGIFTVSAKTDGDRCNRMFDWITTTLVEHGVSHVVCEDYFFSKRFATGSPVNVLLRAAVYMAARRLGIEYTLVSPSVWKTFVAGRSTPTKDQIKKWNKVHAKKFFIQQALWEKYGFRFPNHVLSLVTNKPIRPKADNIDACGIGVYYAGCVKQIPRKNIALSVECPPDVQFKTGKGIYFEYPPSKEDQAGVSQNTSGKTKPKKINGAKSD